MTKIFFFFQKVKKKKKKLQNSVHKDNILKYIQTLKANIMIQINHIYLQNLKDSWYKKLDTDE